MAAPVNCCRLKLSVQENSASRFHKLWYTIDYNECETVESAIRNICEVLKLDNNNRDLYMQNIVVPKWEACVRVFRDNDEVDLKCAEDINSELLSVPNHVEPLQKDSTRSDLKRTLSQDKIKSRKKKKKSKVGDKGDGEPGDREIGTREWQPAAERVDLNREELDSVEEPCHSGADSTPTNAARKLCRSAQLTPIEQQLVAEMDNLPKPKRHRKHKRKKSKKGGELSETVDTTAVSESAPVAAPPVLNSSYHGSKTVFESEDEKVEASKSVGVDTTEEPVKSVSEVLESNTFPDESLSKVQVTPRITSRLSTTKSVTRPAAGANPHLGPGNRLTGVKGAPGKDKPVVYKREKMKLRATISPAILEHLQTSAECSQLEVDSVGGLSPQTGGGACNGSNRKGFKWHQTNVKSSPNRPLVKGTRPGYKQTNLSSFHVCESPSITSSVRELGDTPPIVQEVTDTPPIVQEVTDTPPIVQEVTDTPPIVQEVTDKNCFKDYNAFPSLDGPPRKGDRLAFKRLQISADCTPIISEFQEGRVVSYEPKSKIVHVKDISQPKEPRGKRTGLFDVHIEGDEETLTNVDDNQTEIVDVLPTFFEAKLLPSCE